MRRLSLGIGILMVLGTAPAMFADITDYMLNVNGTTYCPSYGRASCSDVVGFADAGAVSSIDETYGGTGLGTVSLLFNPGGTGPYNVNLWIYEQLSGDAGGAGFNEYGTTGGSLASGQFWQIDVPDYDSAFDPNTSAAGTIIGNTAASTLANANYVPGGSGLCPGPNCNDFTSLALGFNFTLGAGQEELLTFTVSTTAPSSGFYLEQIHPANDRNDGGNNAEIDYYFSGTATSQAVCDPTAPDCGPPPPPVPEPGSLSLLGTAVALLGWALRSRFATPRVG